MTYTPQRITGHLEGTVLVELDAAEVLTCEMLGALRHHQHLRRHNGKLLGGAFNGRDEDVIGLYAEYAVGKYLNCHVPFVFEGWEDKSIPDVGTLYEVRSSLHQKGRLILHEADRDDRVWVLARPWEMMENGGVSVRVGGWVWGFEGKREEYWGRHQGFREECYLVPHTALHSMDDVPRDESTRA